MNIVILVFGVMMLVAAVFSIETKRIIDSVIGLSVVSLLSVLLFVFMKAPDVAITEASIGAGLVTAVFLISLFRMRGGDES